MRLLIVTAVPREAEAVGAPDDTDVVVGGVGRTNAAAATTEAIVRKGPFDLVVSTGFAGALPGAGLGLGDVVVASACVYMEEGLLTPDGYADMAGLGFPLGDFEGNRVPVDARAADALASEFASGAIATVATCSGTDDLAAEVVRRTGAVAEAMEGAAVVHAARRLGVAGIEIRAISNTCGDRGRQQWDLGGARRALGEGVARAVRVLRS
jgi:futalosine hydrolase